MKMSYSQPEFKVFNMINEDILTTSVLNSVPSGFEAGTNITPGDDMAPFIEI